MGLLAPLQRGSHLNSKPILSPNSKHQIARIVFYLKQLFKEKEIVNFRLLSYISKITADSSCISRVSNIRTCYENRSHHPENRFSIIQKQNSFSLGGIIPKMEHRYKWACFFSKSGNSNCILSLFE